MQLTREDDRMTHISDVLNVIPLNSNEYGSLSSLVTSLPDDDEYMDRPDFDELMKLAPCTRHWYVNATTPGHWRYEFIAERGGQVYISNGAVYETYPPEAVHYGVEDVVTTGLPDVFARRTFDHFSVELYGSSHRATAERALRMARKYTEMYAQMRAENGAGLYLCSRKRGSGKTFLATIIGAELERKGERVRFFNMPTMLAEIMATYDKDSNISTAAVVGAVIKAPCVILDDIGVEKASDWANRQLYHILNERITHNRPTLFTSNLTIDELESPVNGRGGTYDDRVTSRIRSRAAMIQMPEESVRDKLASIQNAKIERMLEA